MRVLVTGGAGFVGAHVVAGLAAAGHEVVALHRGPLDPERARLIGAGTAVAPVFLQGDVRDDEQLERVLQSERPTHVVHAAALTPNRAQERTDSRRIVETNELSTLTLLVAAVRHHVTRFLYVSSAAVYASGDAERPLDEEAPLCDPCGLYAVTKLGGERLCRWASQTLAIDVRAVRLGPVYGPFERSSASRPNVSAVCLAAHLALAGEPLRCNAPHARQDWIHGDDAARAVGSLLTTPLLRHDVYNLAGPSVRMDRLFAVIGDAIPHTRVEWVAAPEQANVPVRTDQARGPLDWHRLVEDTGFRPRFTIESGVRHYVTCVSHR